MFVQSVVYAPKAWQPKGREQLEDTLDPLGPAPGQDAKRGFVNGKEESFSELGKDDELIGTVLKANNCKDYPGGETKSDIQQESVKLGCSLPPF